MPHDIESGGDLSSAASSASSSGSVEGPRSTSALQMVLKLAHAPDVASQQRAALELGKLVDGASLPAVSVGPVAHALCRLVPSEHRTVACYAARAAKVLLPTGEIRQHAVEGGIGPALADAAAYWLDADETPALRELLGALQTLTADSACVGEALDCGLAETLAELLATDDLEVRLLASATLANVLALADSALLTRPEAVDPIDEALEDVLALARSRERVQRCYAVAAVANAAAHPQLCASIAKLGGRAVLAEIERASRQPSLDMSGTKIAECAQTAIARLDAAAGRAADQSAEARERAREAMARKYTFTWGNRPMMTLALDPSAHRRRLQLFGCVWCLAICVLLRPLVLAREERVS